MSTSFLFDGPAGRRPALVLAHGAGAGMESPFLTSIAARIGELGWRVARFEFPYMAARRDGSKRAPDSELKLLDTWRTVVAELGGPGDVVIGGKSLGGRMASMVADELGVRGLVCLGYPFHAPGRPDRPRTAHLAGLRTPALVVQGTRDPFGRPEEVAAYALSPAIRLHWMADGDHDLAPRKASGRTRAENWEETAMAVAGFLESLVAE